MKKRIGIDCRLYSQTGVGTYIRNLLHFLSKEKSLIEFFLYLNKDDAAQVTINNPSFQKKIVESRWHSVSEQTRFLKTLLQDKLDLMHFTYFSYPAFYNRPFIATIHDLTPYLFKTGRASAKNPLIYNIKYKAYQFVLHRQIQNAIKIITPSETVKKQILKTFDHIDQSKIVTIPEGVSYELIEADQNQKMEEKFGNNFFIYVGNFYPHKNIEILIKAFKEIKSDYKLILLGPADFFEKKMQSLVKNLGLSDRIHFYHDGSIEDLKFFYKNAQALIHPSLSEGFGLPVVEAAYFKCPVIASDIEIFREIAGDNFVKFNPKDINSIKDAISNFISLDKNKRPLIKLSSKFSFEKMAQNTLKLYLSSSK